MTGPAADGRTSVLDASAVLAWLRGEPGADNVEKRLPTAVMSAVNFSETWQKLQQNGIDADRLTRRMRALGVDVEPVGVADAVAAAGLWQATRSAGLSLGDRCCLALAIRLGVPAVTADAVWAELDLGVPIEVVR